MKLKTEDSKVGKFFYSLLPAVCCLLSLAATSFSAEKIGVKAVAVITGDEVTKRLKQPSGLFFDEAKKRLYVADSGNGRLVSYDQEFKYLSELSHEGLMLPSSLVRDKEGYFFVVDSGKGEIVFIDLEKKVVKPLAITGMPPAKEKFVPGRMAMDKDGRLYVIDKLNKKVVVLATSGAFLREITVKDKEFFGFTDVKVDERGDVYAIDTVAGAVYVFDENGKMVSKFGSREKGIFRFPVSLAVDKKGLIYVADQHAGKILVFDRKGVFQYDMLRPGVKQGELSYPSYIFIDKEGRVSIIDSGRVQIFTIGEG